MRCPTAALDGLRLVLPPPLLLLLLSLLQPWDAAAAVESVVVEADGDIVEPVPNTSLSFSSVKVLYMNLDKRVDRRQQLEERLTVEGIHNAERFSATFGKRLKFKKMVKKGIITEEGLEQLLRMEDQPTCSSGGDLTAGAVGLLHSWDRFLRRMQNESSRDQVWLMLEDDIKFEPDFRKNIDDFLRGLAEIDPSWHLASIGWLTGHPSDLADARLARRWPNIGKLNWIAGTQGVMLHGSRGATAMLEAIFPVGAWGQLDVRIRALAQRPKGPKEESLRMYCARNRLVSAPNSKAGETDIQTCDR